MGGKKKKQFVQEELKPKAPQIIQLMDKSDMDKTQFISFMPEDAIYHDKTYILKGDRHLKNVMRELLKQLNWLRYLSFKQFWATVQFNLSLRYCLQSCLLFFQRKKYNQYYHVEPESENEDNDQEEDEFPDKMPKDQEVIQYQQHIYRIVLIIYFRIIQAYDQDPKLSKQFKCAQAVYDNWIMDIPKLFNFMEIYGQSNYEITKILVQKVFQLNGDFKLDFIDVLAMMSRHVFTDIFEEFKFLHNRSEFEKQINQDTLRKKMKHFLLIKDITSSFLNIFQFFPLDVKVNVISSDVLGPLQNLYYQIFQAYKNWQFNEFKQNVHSLMDSIQQDLIDIWAHLFQLLRRVILQQTNMAYIDNFYSIKDMAMENMNIIGQEFGIVASQGKKGKEKRNYMLLEQIIQNFELEGFLQQLLGMQNKKVDKNRIKQLLNVVVKLTQLKQKRKNPNAQSKQQQEPIQEQIKQTKQLIKGKSETQKPLPEIINIRKQSTKFQNAESKQEKEDNINNRMQRVRNQRLQKTNQREYDDEYDDFYDFNRKMEENNQDSDDEIEEIQDNPNRRYHNRNNQETEKPKTQGGTGSRYQQKNSKYIEKKESDKPGNKSYYRQSNRGDDNHKRGGGGDKRDHYKPGGNKKQYRQK